MDRYDKARGSGDSQRSSRLSKHSTPPPWAVGPLTMSIARLSADAGVKYLLKTTAHGDVDVKDLTDYYTKSGNPRGTWLGAGLEGVGLLPGSIVTDAAANSGRAALLMHALTAQPSLLLAGTRDYLHQEYRSAAMPESAALVSGLRDEGHAAFISGAGPTVMVLANGAAEADTIVQRITAWGANPQLAAETGVSWRVLRLQLDLEGAKVEVHP